MPENKRETLLQEALLLQLQGGWRAWQWQPEDTLSSKKL